MPWPISQDYNEAIQTPASALDDPELKAGEPVLNALGLPLPRSGNFADVYEFVGASGAKWAVKCFTREVPGLQQRYSEISKHLVHARLPFTVDFQYLPRGIRIRGQWYPILKMRWVDGLLFNQFVRDSLDKKVHLKALGQIWLRMARRLRDARLAHADLQHGNIILVPGSKAASLAIKLIDYDGMFVPALAGKESGEVGHPAYQHPQRLREGAYNAEVDRFSLLAIFSSLRSLMLEGRSLWDRFDNGDNLLFREADFKKPEASALFQGLWQVNDAGVHDLVGHLALACRGTLPEVPVLDLMVNDQVRPLSPAQEENLTALMGPGARVQRGKESVSVPATAMDPFGSVMFAESVARPPKRQAARPLWPWLAGALVLLLLAVLLVILSGPRSGTEQAHHATPPLPKAKKPQADNKKNQLKDKKDLPPDKILEKVVQPPEDPKTDPPIPAKAKVPPPTPVQIAEAKKELRQTFADLYDRDDKTGRRKLAAALLKHSQNSTSGVRYVCLRDAGDLAATTIDAKLLFDALRRMENAFDMAMMPHLERTLELVLANSKDLHHVLIGLRLLDEAKRSDEFATTKIGDLIRTAAKRFPKDPNLDTLLTSLDKKEKLLKKVEEEYQKGKHFLPVTEASDPKALNVVGRYHAFIKEDWARGLPLLAACGEQAVATLAAKDLENPMDAQAQAKLANAWWDHARKTVEETTLARSHIRKRATYWAHKSYAALPENQKRQLDDYLKIPYVGKSFLKPGLVAEFFQGPQLIRKRIDHQLNFKTGFSHDAQVPPRGFKARWRGFLLISQTGSYRISLDGAGPFSLSVDNEEVLAGTKSDNRIETQRILGEGLHPVEIHYENLAGDAQFSAAWDLADDSSADHQNVLYYHLPKK